MPTVMASCFCAHSLLLALFACVVRDDELLGAQSNHEVKRQVSFENDLEGLDDVSSDEDRGLQSDA